MQNETDELIATIREGIRKRGFFLLMDDRLELIVQAEEEPVKFSAIQEFAKSHGWDVKQEDDGLLFHNLPSDSTGGGKAGEILKEFDDLACLSFQFGINQRGTF